MTFNEAKTILSNMRAAKRRANAIKARIADIEGDYASIRRERARINTITNVMTVSTVDFSMLKKVDWISLALWTNRLSLRRKVGAM